MALNLASLRIVDSAEGTPGGTGGAGDVDPGASRLVQELFQDGGGPQQQQQQQQQQPPGAQGSIQTIRPTPGLCIKTDTSKGDKLFINLCHSDKLPSPPNIGDEALALAVATSDSSKYQVPMSFSEPHAELDNAGKGCTAYDVAVATEVFQLAQERQGIKDFIIELVFCNIEHRSDVLLNREFKILRKRTHMGTMVEHRCRVKKRIREVEAPNGGIPEPEYSMQMEPPEGRPEFIVLDIKLPDLRTTANSTLDVGEDRLLLISHPKRYRLDLRPQWPLDPDNTGAQFNRDTRILTVTSQVLP